MPSKNIQKVVDRITTVAKRAAAANGVQFGIVQSRNPDGSLNVRPIGAAGCMRVIGKQNARVGDKIPLTNEPALGTGTSLEEYDFNVPSPGLSCPDDPRPDPKSPPEVKPIPFQTAFVKISTGDWHYRDDPGHDANASLPYPHNENYSAVGATGSFFIAGSDYDNNPGNIPPSGNGPYLCSRSFIGLDLSTFDPGTIIDSIDLTGHIYSFQPTSFSDLHVYAVRSLTDLPLVIPAYPADFPVDAAIVPHFDPSATYGSLRINDYHSGNSFTWHIEGFETFYPKTTIALIGENDLTGNVPYHGAGTSSWIDELVFERITVSVSGSVAKSFL